MQQEGAKGLSAGVIMDGNGRWAKMRCLPRTAGHKKGADVLDDITRYANELGMCAITYYAFSTENWNRPQSEVDALMDLFQASLKRLYKYRKENNRVVFLGDRGPLAQNLRDMMDEIEDETASRTGMIMNIAINYGGRQEITRAARLLAEQVATGHIKPDGIDEAAVEAQLYTAGQPMPDFIIRTSGEMRLSNFMLWQSAYAEFICTDVLWPDFTREDFDTAIAAFHRRGRRFGGV